MTEPNDGRGPVRAGRIAGRGGMAEVRVPVDQRLGRSVAVKQLRDRSATDPTFRRGFGARRSQPPA
jgi:serine/threonine-protein kinase